MGERAGGRVLVCGLATLDVVQTVERVPTANEKVVAAGLAVAAGGPAANAAVTCAALGVPVWLVTRIGGGALAEVVREDLVRAGVEVVDLARPGASPPVSTVLVTRATGERAVVSVNATVGGAGTAGPAGGEVPAEGEEPARGEVPAEGEVPARGEVPAEVWDDVALVLVDGHHLDLGVAVAAEARRRGVPVLLDGGSWKPGLEALLASVDVAVVSADFVVPDGAGGAAGGDRLDALLRLGPSVAARSAGSGPIEVAVGEVAVGEAAVGEAAVGEAAVGEAAVGAARASVAVPSVGVVDTLGAGDVLHGALAAWLAVHEWVDGGPGGQLDGVAAALGWAAGVASASCSAAGARGWTADAVLVARLRAELGTVGPVH